MKREDVKRNAARLVRRALLLALVSLQVSLATTPAAAQPTQEEVFRSISQNVNQSADGGKFLAVIAGAAGIVLLLAVIQKRKTREARPKSVQHPGRLLKEVMKSVPLKPGELKQLKLLVERGGGEGEADDVRVENPLTLLLCPSVLVKSMQSPPSKVDRKVIGQLARKLSPPTPALNAARPR